MNDLSVSHFIISINSHRWKIDIKNKKYENYKSGWLKIIWEQSFSKYAPQCLSKFGKFLAKYATNTKVNHTQWALYPSTRESRKEKVGKGYK